MLTEFKNGQFHYRAEQVWNYGGSHSAAHAIRVVSVPFFILPRTLGGSVGSFTGFAAMVSRVRFSLCSACIYILWLATTTQGAHH